MIYLGMQVGKLCSTPGRSVSLAAPVVGYVGGDVEIGVHRVVAEEGAVLYVQFDAAATPAALRVVVTRDFRPTPPDFGVATPVSAADGWVVRSTDAAQRDDTWYVVPRGTDLARRWQRYSLKGAQR